MSRADLDGADLYNAYMRETVLVGASLNKTILEEAYIFEVNLNEAHLDAIPNVV